ncbi:MAG: protease complex subunit PrcB family protein [Lachnospiraceae bacterium]
MMMLFLAGCAGESTEEDKLKDIEFTVIGEDQQPDSLKEIVAEKSAQPFQISYTLGEELYIAVGYGEQPSGGYSISVNAFYETEESLVIDTTLIGPGKAENVTNTPTRPYVVIKTENIADKAIEFK